MGVDTSIKISVETRKALEKLKIHPRQSYDEVIRSLLSRYSMASKRR